MEIKPFKAFRYNRDVVCDAGRCIAPPYDVISDVQQEELYKKSEYNIVRITKGKTKSSDDAADNKYTRAAEYFNVWLKTGVLKQDSTESIYAYIQDFQVAGADFQRSSFIALGKLEEFGKIVKPHEQTLDGPKIDRLNLQRATAAVFGLVFMLYEDGQNIAGKIIKDAASREALIDFVDEQNVRHRLFAITSKDNIDKIAKMMVNKSCIIADGHHRYETALNYYKETSNSAAAYQMTAFVNTCHDGLLILATHRLVGNLKGFCLGKFIESLKEKFEIREYRYDSSKSKEDAKQKMLSQMKIEHALDKNAFGLYGGNNTFYVAVLKNKRAMDSVAPGKSRAWKSLDVSVLHRLIMEGLLGIGEKQLANESNIEYIKDTGGAVDESIEKVDAGQKQVVFFMNTVKMRQLKMVTDAGEKMPQKSTFFYPKMYTGLTINKF